MERETDRTRINIKTTAKGTAQIDITAEYETPEKSAEMLADAIVRTRKILQDQDIKLAE